MFNAAIAHTGGKRLPTDDWFDGCIALAIDPLYAQAAKVFPEVALYHSGLSYCLCEMKSFDEALPPARKAVELEPDDYCHLNDLGWTLFEAGRLDEAKSVLEQSVALSPDEYECSRNNLTIVLTAIARR